MVCSPFMVSTSSLYGAIINKLNICESAMLRRRLNVAKVDVQRRCIVDGKLHLVEPIRCPRRFENLQHSTSTL